MEVISAGVVVTLERSEATALARQLAEALQLAYVARGSAAPRLLTDFANGVSRAVRGFADVRANAQVSMVCERSGVRGQPFLSSSAEPVWLTAEEAARIAEVSVQTMRRFLREGDPRGSREAQSAWRVDANDLTAWLSRRRKEIAQKAA